MQDIDPKDYPAWENTLCQEGIYAPDDRGLRRWALRQILIHRRGDVPESTRHALDALGKGLAPSIDAKAMEALTKRIESDRPALEALCHITPWRLPTRRLLCDGWVFDKRKISFTLPYHMVMWLLLDMRERGVANLEWIRLVRKIQRYCEHKDTLGGSSGPIVLFAEIDAFAARRGLLIGEDARNWIWPSELAGSPALFGRANAQLRRIGDKRTPGWMALGVARRFTKANEGRAALNAAVGALASIVVAACDHRYTPQLGLLIRVAVEDLDNAIARRASAFIDDKDALHDALTSFHASLAEAREPQEASL